MTISVSDLLTRYPEFKQASPELIQACIDQAETLVDRNFYGTAKADIAVKALAAHYISINPLGEMARLDKKSDKTIYKIEFDQVKRTLGAGCRVI